MFAYTCRRLIGLNTHHILISTLVSDRLLAVATVIAQPERARECCRREDPRLQFLGCDGPHPHPTRALSDTQNPSECHSGCDCCPCIQVNHRAGQASSRTMAAEEVRLHRLDLDLLRDPPARRDIRHDRRCLVFAACHAQGKNTRDLSIAGMYIQPSHRRCSSCSRRTRAHRTPYSEGWVRLTFSETQVHTQSPPT